VRVAKHLARIERQTACALVAASASHWSGRPETSPAVPPFLRSCLFANSVMRLQAIWWWQAYSSRRASQAMPLSSSSSSFQPWWVPRGGRGWRQKGRPCVFYFFRYKCTGHAAAPRQVVRPCEASSFLSRGTFDSLKAASWEEKRQLARLEVTAASCATGSDYAILSHPEGLALVALAEVSGSLCLR
jgi:hypothetical protein